MSNLSRLGITRPRPSREHQQHAVPIRSLPGPSRATSMSTNTSRRASRGSSAHHAHVPAGQTTSNAEWVGTHINDLQHLSFLKIFSFLTKDELQTTRRVCRSWLHLINNEFGIKCIMNNSNSEVLATSPWIVDANLLNVTLPIKENGIACASRLKVLQLTGMCVSYNLIPLLQTCTHLQSLTFGEPSIDLTEQAIIRTVKGAIHLRELTKLTFESWSYTDSINTIARVLCYVHFGNLKSLNVRAVHPPVLPLGNIFTNFDEVPNEASPMVRLIMLNLGSLEHVAIGTLISQSTFVFVPNTARPGELVQLKELTVQNLYMNWTSMLEGQSHMTHLTIGHCQNQQWTAIRNCITRCVNQLEKVKIQGRTFGIPWDCDIFLECRNLKELILNLTLSPKRGLISLPNTLTTLTLDGPVERPEFLRLHNRNFSNLKTLQLNCLGLNFVILQLQQGPPNNAPPDQVDLLLFLGLIWHLSNLTELSFKDCSQDSLEWDKINSWCRKAVAQNPGITYNVHNFDMHGQSIQHGLTLTLPPQFDRTKLNIPQLQVEGQAPVQPARGIMGAILHLFGMRN